MPDEQHDNWIKSVLGIDPGQFAVGAAVAAGVGLVGGAIALGMELFGHGQAAPAAAKPPLQPQPAPPPKPGPAPAPSDPYASRFGAAMATIGQSIALMQKSGLVTGPYEVQSNTFNTEWAVAGKIADPAARAKAEAKVVQAAEAEAVQIKDDARRSSASAVEGVGSAVTDMRDGAKAQIDKLDKKGHDWPELSKRLGDLDKDIAGVAAITDRPTKSKKLKEISRTAEALLDSAIAATKDNDAAQAIYAKALQDRYGFTISNPKNIKNTHLDQVYKMFDKVPATDVVQGKLQKLIYQPTSIDEHGVEIKNTGAAYGGAEIEMGDYGSEDWIYTNAKDGKPLPINGFSISTLHELGHSVDDRFGIMSANKGNATCGGWKDETIASVATAFIGHFKAGAGKGLAIDDRTLSGLVNAALGGAVPTTAPHGMAAPVWAAVAPLLADCAARRNDKWPWGAAHDIGGRTYHEAYAGEWVSYDSAVRGKQLTVRDYQWRAPAEWFAELYAYTWFKSEAPPASIDKAAAAYMYGGSAAGGAPAASH
jgi:hypothetical protein